MCSCVWVARPVILYSHSTGTKSHASRVLGVRSLGLRRPGRSVGCWSKPRILCHLHNHQSASRDLYSIKVYSTGARPSTRPSIVVLVTGTAANASLPPHRTSVTLLCETRDGRGAELTQFPCIEPSPSSECTSLPQHACLKCSNRTAFRLNWRQNPQRGRQETQWPAMNAVKPFEPHRAH